MKTVALLFIILLSTAPVAAKPQNNYTPVLDALVKAFNDKDTSALTPYLADAFSIEGVEKGTEKQVLAQLADNPVHIDGYEIVNEAAENNNTRLLVHFKFVQAGTKGTLPINLLINAGNKIQEFNPVYTPEKQKAIESHYTAQIDAVLKMFQNKDATALKDVVAENYTIGRTMPGSEEELLNSILFQFPVIESYYVTAETKEKGGTRVAVNFKILYAGKLIDYKSNFLINSDNKIQELNILENAQINGNRTK
jgi:hypothetical protein